MLLIPKWIWFDTLFCVNAHSRLVYKQVPVGTDFPLANFNVRVLSVSNWDMMVPFKGGHWQKATFLVKLQVASWYDAKFHKS